MNLAPSLLPLYLRQCSLRLRQPEDHVHGPVQRDGSGQLGTSLRLLGYGIQRAEPRWQWAMSGRMPSSLARARASW